MLNLLKRLWVIMKSRSSAAMGFILLIGFFGGIIFWGGFNTAMEATNNEAFCISCHAMRDNVYQEYRETIHYANRSGVRATCPDCHVPKDWTDKLIRKIQASQEVWGTLVGVIDSREKFVDKRRHMAEREWKRMKENDSLECRNCHNFAYMDFTEQGPRSVKMHSTALASGEQTCIDCHKGIAHELPDMSGVEGW